MDRLDYHNDTKNPISEFVEGKKGIITTSAIVIGSVLSSSVVFAADGLTGEVQRIVGKIYSFLLTIVNPIALLSASICIMTLFFSRNSQKAESAYEGLGNIIKAFIGMNLLGLIVTTASGWVKSNTGAKLPWS